MSRDDMITIEAKQINGFECLGCGTLFRQHVQFCLVCNRSGLVVPRFQRPADAQAPVPPGLTARELAKLNSPTVHIAAMPGVVVAPGAFVVGYAPPGHGKTTLAIQVADSLTPSIYLALEEGLGPSLAAKLRRLEIHSEQIRFETPRSTSEVFELATRRGLRSLVIDSASVSTLVPSDCMAIARARKIIVWANLQVTKAGLPAGTNRWLHDADVVVRVHEMRWRVEKSRYQEAGKEGNVLCDMGTGTPACTA